MEEKKGFINPVVWAKHCFGWSIFVVGMIGVGIILSFLVKVFDYNTLAEESFVNTLKGIITAIYGLFFLAGSILFYPILLATLLGSFIALIGLLITKEKKREPYFHVFSSILISIGLFIFVIFIHLQYLHAMTNIVCHTNIKRLSEIILEQVKSEETRFTKETWCDLIKEEVNSEKTFKCHKDKTGPCSYAMNENIPADANELPDDLVVLFESAPGWNQTGGQDDVVTDRHSRPGANIAFADGHVEFIDADKIPTLRWTINKSPKRQ